MYRREVLFSVDEWSFERSIKKVYSWPPVGTCWWIINDIFKTRRPWYLEQAHPVLGLHWLLKRCQTLKRFNFYLRFLQRVISDTSRLSHDAPVIIIDNARIHTSKYTKGVISKLGIQVWYLPPYWPEVAAVGFIFRATKVKLRSVQTYETIDFHKQSGLKEIMNALGALKKTTWEQAWQEVWRKAKRNIFWYNNFITDSIN